MLLKRKPKIVISDEMKNKLDMMIREEEVQSAYVPKSLVTKTDTEANKDEENNKDNGKVANVFSILLALLFLFVFCSCCVGLYAFIF